MKTAIFDIDGTVSDSRGRMHHLPKDRSAFHAGCIDDPVIVPMLMLIRATSYLNTEIVLCTGRPKTYADETIDWLDRNDVPFDELHLKPVEMESTPNVAYKLGVLQDLRARGHEIVLAVDDDLKVVAMYRANGVHCLHTQAV